MIEDVQKMVCLLLSLTKSNIMSQMYLQASGGYRQLKITFGNSTTLIINSYFPTDPRKPNADQSDLLQTLGHIRNVIRKNKFDSLLWAGDINADFLRNTSHTSIIQENVEELGLIKAWDLFDIDFTCCHELLGASHVSILDHFFWSENLGEYVKDAGVIHLPDNRSDHCPVFCVLELQHNEKNEPQMAQQKPRPSWKKSKQDQKDSFKTELEDRLSNLATPQSISSCKEVGCRDIEHKEDLDIFTLDLLETVQIVAEENLSMPTVGGKDVGDKDESSRLERGCQTI